jgi:hypothetical protein
MFYQKRKETVSENQGKRTATKKHPNVTQLNIGTIKSCKIKLNQARLLRHKSQ